MDFVAKRIRLTDVFVFGFFFSTGADDGNQLRRCDWLQGVQAAGSAAAVAAAAAAAAAAASDAPPSYASSGVGVGRDAAPVRGATKKERRHHHHHHHPHHPHHPHHQAHHGHAHHGHAHHHGQRPYAGGRSNGRTVAAVARRPYAECVTVYLVSTFLPSFSLSLSIGHRP